MESSYHVFTFAALIQIYQEIQSDQKNCQGLQIMRNARRYAMIILWSFAIALGFILYTVGLSHENLGYERRWIYPLLFSFIPAFCLQRGFDYIFLRKQRRKK